LLTPILLNTYGPSVAFGVPGALMIIATIIFWMGHKVYTVVPPAGLKKYKIEVIEKKGYKVILKLCVVYLFIAVFWSLFDQTGSSWILQANSDFVVKSIDLGFGWIDADWLKFTLLPSQVQAVNPILILIFVPIFTFFIYPAMSKMFKLTPLKKITIGMFIAAISFAIVAWMEAQIVQENYISILWQFLAYAVLTAAEVMVSITALEFSYTQAPNSMKSLIMGFYLLSVSFGNFIAAAVNGLIERPDGTMRLTGPEYFWFFTILMLVTAVFFIIVAVKYKEKTYIQGDDGDNEADPYIWEQA
jgi:proton-dependent oligopeptide transporter, POT family